MPANLMKKQNNRFKTATGNRLTGIICLSVMLLIYVGCQNKQGAADMDPGSREAGPWVFWYWMHGAVSEQGIRADLEAMKSAGIRGAYIFAIKDTISPFSYKNRVRQLTPEWWKMVRYAYKEAERLDLVMAFNVCDGFATAGGPWITPELSMQRVVWTDTIVSGKQSFSHRLPPLTANLGYSRDIAVFAFPAREGAGETSFSKVPVVSASLAGVQLQFLAQKGNTRTFSTRDSCWIQYSFTEPFPCRSVIIHTGWYNYQANRLIVEVSDDGVHFRKHCRLEPYRHGWQDTGAPATHLVRPVTSRFFRFVYTPAGTEPGAEDLDNAKWIPELRIAGIELSGDSKVNQYEGKSGAAWRITQRTTAEDIPDRDCIDPAELQDLTALTDENGILHWEVPDGRWTILRMGHTPTGYDNATGGGGRGPECDKLNPTAVKLQFDRWFGERLRQTEPDGKRVVKLFHVDSWECGSQNWSPVFRDEFRKRRGYDLMPWLPVMAGIPLKDAASSEKFLYDVRMTISELVACNFYGTLSELAHRNKCLFSAESIAPVFTSDGMLHYRHTDLPMGEFWLRSPSHDKPNDILDAVSAGHIYGKKIIQAEGFTEIRLDWDEHPGMMKSLADYYFAAGINRLVYHVFTHNPWMNRKPGMTLDRIGTFIQRDQTWWKHANAWNNYIARCQEWLHKGIPVTDIAVFTGEEIPSRALLPDRLVEILPGVMGEERVMKEKIRMLNAGTPIREIPRGVGTLENMADPEEWNDPLCGYKYDSFNKDALLRLATTKGDRIVLPGGSSYRLLVVPGHMKMNPEGSLMSIEVVAKLLELVKNGASLLMMGKPSGIPGLQQSQSEIERMKKIVDRLFPGEPEIIPDGKGHNLRMWKVGKGKTILGPYTSEDFGILGFRPDFFGLDSVGQRVDFLAWTHRKERNRDIYFISNQKSETVPVRLSFQCTGKSPEIYLPVNNETIPVRHWEMANGYTSLAYRFQPNESLFVTLGKTDLLPPGGDSSNNRMTETVTRLEGDWKVRFNPVYGGPHQSITIPEPALWNENDNDSIRFYSGTAVYSIHFTWIETVKNGNKLYLETDEVYNMAEVRLNGQVCGTFWTPPYRVNISGHVCRGDNLLEISVTNCWHNRLIRDHDLPADRKLTWTTAPFRLQSRPLLPAGLKGSVRICREK
jgi:hypothetical protein